MRAHASSSQAPDHGVESTPAPHAHWTLYEALQQPMAIARALAFGGVGLVGDSAYILFRPIVLPV